MSQTLRDVSVELRLFEFSQQYLDLLKEEAEIVLCDQYLAMQESLWETSFGPYLSEGYLLERKERVVAEQIKEDNEKRKATFRGKLAAVLIKTYNFVVKCMRRVAEAWHRMFPKQKEALQKLERMGTLTLEDTQDYADIFQEYAAQAKVKPFKTQPAAKMIAKKIKFESNVPAELRDTFIRYVAFGLGDIILIQASGAEIQMDHGVELERVRGAYNDKLDADADANVISTLQSRALEEGIRVRIDGDYFDKIIAYYEKMAERYRQLEKINKPGELSDRQKEIFAAYGTPAIYKRLEGRAQACAMLSNALSATCVVIEHARKYQQMMIGLFCNKTPDQVVAAIRADEQRAGGPVEEVIVDPADVVIQNPDGTPIT